MNIKEEFFLQTLFQVNARTNFNIDNLPSLGALFYQAVQLSGPGKLQRSHFVQICHKFCGLLENDGHLLFNLYQALTGEEDANPRKMTAFIFAVLFKTTVSSRR